MARLKHHHNHSHHHRQRSRPKKVFQDSPFLDLPGEVRELIYRAALIKPTPIDLWPHEYISYPLTADEDRRITARIDKATRHLLPQDRGPYIPHFRRQADLLYVRKEMATGLLLTCRQVAGEARYLFWRENVFRFSGDFEWIGIRRFLTTIGPQALSLIRKIEVFAPLIRPSEVDRWFWGDAWKAKNDPKMHMAKTSRSVSSSSSSWRDVTAEDLSCVNVSSVCLLLEACDASPTTKMLSSSALELDFILPAGFELNDSHSTEIFSLWGYSLMVEQFAKLLTTRTRLVLEAGAYMYGSEQVPSQCAEDFSCKVVCLPGVIWKMDAAMSEDAARLADVWEWHGPADEFDYLNGVAELLDEELFGHFDVPARGGKVNKFAGPRKSSARVLKGFGGCRFVYRYCSECVECRFQEPYNIEPKERPILGQSLWKDWHTCVRCHGGWGRILGERLEVRNKLRANRMAARGY